MREPAYQRMITDVSTPCSHRCTTIRQSPHRIRREAGIEKGSGKPNKEKVGKISRAAVKKIAETKMNDLNATSVEAAMKMVEGTARSMGVEIGG